MNQIAKLKAWLIEKTVHSKNCKSLKVELGTFAEQITMTHDNGISNPFEMCLGGEINVPPSHISFKINNSVEYHVQFIKRIANTPFFYSYLTGEDFSVTTIDFYQWYPNTVLYRMVFIEHQNNSCQLKLYPSSGVSALKGSNYREIGNWRLRSSCKLSSHLNERYYMANLTMTNDGGTSAIFSFTLGNEQLVAPNINDAIKLLWQLEDLSWVKNIKNSFVIQDLVAQEYLDDLWATQKLFTPDGKIDKKLVEDPNHYEYILSWATQVCMYLRWKDNLKQIFTALKRVFTQSNGTWRLLYYLNLLQDYFDVNDVKSKQKSLYRHIKGNQTDPFKQLFACKTTKKSDLNVFNNDRFFYIAFYCDIISSNQIINQLQNWWNIFSLPLFYLRFKKELYQNPEKMFLIYLLALRHKLPWAKNFFEICQAFRHEPVFQFLAFLYSRIFINNEKCNIINILPGAIWDGNLKRVDYNQDNVCIYYTKYSTKIYSKLTQNKEVLFKFDHEVQLKYNISDRTIQIYPNVPCMQLHNYSDRVIKLSVSDYTLFLPLLWRKGDILFSGLRFRWVLKKRRFQFTVIKKKLVDSFCLNNKQLDFNNSFKQKFYIAAEKSAPQIEVMILDESGRGFHFPRGSSLQELIVTGWCRDFHGVFAEYLNYDYAQRQKVIKINASGIIYQKLILPAKQSCINFIMKKSRIIHQIPYIDNEFLKQILRFSPLEWKGDIIVLIDFTLRSRLTEIQKRLSDIFNFTPHIMIYQPDLKYTIKAVLLHISNAHNSLNLKDDKKIASYPFLEVGVKRDLSNIDKIYGYLNQSFNNLDIDAASA